MPSMQKWDISSLEELAEAAAEVLNMSADRKAVGAAVLGLSGDLGAGKTTFVQTLAKKLGVQETVTSPTFVIMKSYSVKGRFKKLVHIDAYRVENIDEMRVLGFAELLEQKDTIICIEWAEKIKELLPKETVQLKFQLVGENRTLTIDE